MSLFFQYHGSTRGSGFLYDRTRRNGDEGRRNHGPQLELVDMNRFQTLVAPQHQFFCRHFCVLKTFPIPAYYDYRLSTEANYAQCPTIPPVFVGQFGSIRSCLDYKYHAHYNKERQLFHDYLVRGFLAASVDSPDTSPEEQWLVFTAGAMGAGKSRCVRWLQTYNLFPCRNVVKVVGPS